MNYLPVKYTFKIDIYLNNNHISKVNTMPNILDRLEIDMEKKIFSFLLVFFIIFLGINVITIIMALIQTFWVIYWYLIPMLVALIFAGVTVDARRRVWCLILLIPEALLTLVVAFVITDTVALIILWIFIGLLSGFTISAMLAFFADITKMEQRGKVTGLIGGIAWIVSGILLSWYSSTLFVASAFMVVIAIVKLAGAGIVIYILFTGIDKENQPPSSSEYATESILDKITASFNFLWSNPKFRTYLIAFVLIMLAQGIFLPIGGLEQEDYQSYQQIASIGFAVGGLLLIVSGYLLDKGRKQVLFYGAILCNISFLSYFFPIGAVFLAGIPIALTTILIVLGDIAPQDMRGRYYAVFLLFSFLAFFCGFLIGLGIGGGYQVGGNPWVVLVCAIITGLGLLLIYLKGEESNIEEVTFPPSSAPPSVMDLSSTETSFTDDSVPEDNL